MAGAYVPQLIDEASLGYTIGANPPDPSIYRFWISTTVGGSPLAINVYYSGAWVDVYAATLVSYQTIAAFNTAIAAYSTTTAMNAAIAAAIAGIPTVATYPAQGVATMQTITISGIAQKVALTADPINPAPSPFDTTNRRYIAPSDGIYLVAASTQFDNDTGTASGMEVGIELYKNNAFVGNSMGDEDNTPSPNGARWSPGFAGLVQLVAGDYIELFATVMDGVNTGNITLTVAQMSVSRVSA